MVLWPASESSNNYHQLPSYSPKALRTRLDGERDHGRKTDPESEWDKREGEAREGGERERETEKKEG